MIFCDFQDGGRHHLEFSKIQNFNIQSGQLYGTNMHHRAKLHQNPSRDRRDMAI